MHKLHEVTQIALFIYLILLISIVANFKYFVYYLTASVLLGLIVLNYYKNYLNTNNKNAFKVMIAFMFILLSNLLLVFVFFIPGVYVVGELIMLLGFLLLLHTYRSVTKVRQR